MERYAVFFQGVCEFAGCLRIAVIEMRGATENFEIVNPGVADGCEERGRERLMRVHVSGKNAVHPAPWQFDDEPWSVEIGPASIVRRCARNARHEQRNGAADQRQASFLDVPGTRMNDRAVAPYECKGKRLQQRGVRRLRRGILL